MGIKIATKESLKVDAVKSVDEFLDRTSDSVKAYAHAIAMTKKGVLLQSEITEEDFDIALEREIAKEWDKVKDLDMDGYMLRVIGELMIDGISLERIFGEDNGKKDS